MERAQRNSGKATLRRKKLMVITADVMKSAKQWSNEDRDWKKQGEFIKIWTETAERRQNKHRD